MKSKITVAVLSASFMISAAMASPIKEGTQQAISFADLKRACQMPAQFHNQVAPTHVQVSCRDSVAKWVPTTEGAVKMPTTRYISTAVQSDKYTVAEGTEAVVSADSIASCPRFKQVAETLAVSRSVSCDEMVAFSGTGTEFCSAVLNELKASNPSAIQMVDTGRVADFCGDANKPNNGQR